MIKRSFLYGILGLGLMSGLEAGIFNGKDLEGWSGDPRLWRVENGVIVGETDDGDRKVGANTFLIYEGEVEDFELSFSARVTGKNNSGVQYRSKVIDPAKWIVGGYQMDMHPKQPFLAMIYEEKGRGIVCQRGTEVVLKEGKKPEVVGKLPMEKLELAEWNDYRIVAKGNRLEHFVNGKPAIVMTDLDEGKRSMKGVLALQLHAGPPMKAEFRDFTLKKLKKEKKEERKEGAGLSGKGGEPLASWIWSPGGIKGDDKVALRRGFDLPPGVKAAAITVTCDNKYRVWLNGKELGGGDDWASARSFDVSGELRQGGRNVIAVSGENAGGSAGMALRFRATLEDGKNLYVVSDGNWRCEKDAGSGWEKGEFDDRNWKAVAVIGPMGRKPWGMVIKQENGAEASKDVTAGPTDMTAEFKVAPDFKLEKLYTVAKEQGSWVSMVFDGKGGLICSDQYGKLYRVTLGERIEVRPMDVQIGGAHGLLWHRGVLYVTVNERVGGEAGVYKVTDSNGDGEPDKVELIKGMQGRGEHGPHSLVASPDGEWIYFCAGNHTDLAEMDASQPARVWDEDQLLPRRPDARGHARGRMAPGGWIARFRPDGSQWELVGIGFRNEFDLAFNEQGDLFSYDADMEWDFGMPWYRPTRICQVVPGAEFGWRNGTGKWPVYYEDSMPAVVDLGPGSPTGLVSGSGAAFPAKYQKAMYALDWTFGTIHAVHLTADGEGYRSEREEFVAGKGLPLTDAQIGPDGAMYFLTGGRKVASALWRVSYTGSEKVDPVPYRNKKLELFGPAEVDGALGSEDRVSRYKARVGLEAMPIESWAAKYGEWSEPWKVVGGAIALARLDAKGSRAKVLDALMGLPWEELDKAQKLAWLRASGLLFIRGGEPNEAERLRVLEKIDGAFPATDDELNRELCRMLCYLQAPGVVGRTLALMDVAGPGTKPDWLELASRNPRYGRTVEQMIAKLPPEQVIHFVYCLRSVKGPWTRNERERFFKWIDRLKGKKGGSSYDGFLNGLREDAIANAAKEEQEWLQKLAPEVVLDPFADLPPVEGPGKLWTVDEVEALMASGLDEVDRERGKRMFQGGLCAACHRYAGEGGAAGPDLTAVGGRFSARDLATALIDPSAEVSDQYAFEVFTKEDGSQVIGRAVDEKDEKMIIAINPFDFSQTTEVSRSELKGRKLSPISPMPGGLINQMNADEVKALFGYLLGK